MPGITFPPTQSTPQQQPAKISPQQVAPRQSSFTFSAPPPSALPSNAFAPSPIAPAYSPITPKVQPILPARSQDGSPSIIVPPGEPDQQVQQNIQPSRSPPAIAPATFKPPAPPQPFSSEDSTDAIALRAAISALQFQKKKAQDDLRTLDGVRRAAINDPKRFRNELREGRLREQRPDFGGKKAILDDSDEDEDDNDDDDMDDTKMRDADATKHKSADKEVDFSRVPGPQNVVRMPHINWEKYHIVGSALDQMHEQQRKWPGSNFTYSTPSEERAREFSVAAPYSPFQDALLEGAAAGRKDSVAGTAAASASPSTAPVGNGFVAGTGVDTVSEHPMETRRGSSKPHGY